MKTKKIFNYWNVIFPFIILSYFLPVTASSHYDIACYYYDSDLTNTNINESLIKNNKNYYRALEPNLTNHVKLYGHIEDGFFIENLKTYDNIVKRCKETIYNKNSKRSLKLYDFKAFEHRWSGYEYPIRFLNSEVPNPIKQIVIFGDSLSDTGNLKRWTRQLPQYPYWFGRFSNGFIWNDYLSNLTRIPILNFSYGGSKTDGYNFIEIQDDYKAYFKSTFKNILTGSTESAIANYSNNYLTKDSYSSKSDRISKPQETLYMIWIGANDYLAAFANESYTYNFFYNPNSDGGANTIKIRTVKNILNQIRMLHSKGATHFFIPNIIDFGKIPLILNLKYNKYNDNNSNINEFAKKISEEIKEYNNHLENSIKALQRELRDSIKIVYFDIDSNFDSLIDSKDIHYTNLDFDYGFKLLNSTYPIIGKSEKFVQNYCYQGNLFGTSKSQSLLFTIKDKAIGSLIRFFLRKSTSENIPISLNSWQIENLEINKFSIFWDKSHPTSYSHCWINYAIIKKLEENYLLIQNPNLTIEKYKKYCEMNVNGAFNKN